MKSSKPGNRVIIRYCKVTLPNTYI